MTTTVDDAMRDMEAAIYEAAECRRKASEARQDGYPDYARFLSDNAKGAERWLEKAGRAYPRRCDAQGKAIKEARKKQ